MYKLLTKVSIEYEDDSYRNNYEDASDEEFLFEENENEEEIDNLKQDRR